MPDLNKWIDWQFEPAAEHVREKMDASAVYRPPPPSPTQVITEMWDAFHMANSVEEGRVAAIEILITRGAKIYRDNARSVQA